MKGQRDGRGAGGLPGEFDLIARYFAPLAADAPGAFGMRDDGAEVAVDAGEALVLTTDCLVAGVHFLPDDPPDLVARKALRVNLSDLAAMGARPIGYLVALMLNRDVDEAWVAAYAAGLALDQETFGVALYGGDTAFTPGPLALSVTAFGAVRSGASLRRSGARPGDLVFVSGTIGGGLLGLRAARGELAEGADRDRLLLRYRLPEPRIALGRALAGTASAALDVSDGLIADLDHIAGASSVAIGIELALVPFDPAVPVSDAVLQRECLCGGDDYELAFTAPAGREEAIVAAAAAAGVAVTRIGRVLAGTGTTVRDRDGAPVVLVDGGFRHF